MADGRHEPDTRAGPLQRRGVNEDVLAAIFWLDETKAFLAVIEFHCTRGHSGYSFRLGRCV